MSVHAGGGTYALLADGTTIEIRQARPDDFDAVRDMHEKMSQDNLYLRFFSVSSVAAERAARRICREPGPDHAALLAVLDGEVVGYGVYERFGAGSPSAEIAMAVTDDMHNRGVGTLLLEHLISLARGRGVLTFVAETLSENALMLKVFADAGLPAQRILTDGVYEVRFPLPADEADAALGTYRDAVAERERFADVASLRHVLTPGSVAVIGAGGQPGSPGRRSCGTSSPAPFPARSTRSTWTQKSWTALPACRRRPRCPAGRPSGHRCTSNCRPRYRRRMRAAGGQGLGRDHLGSRRHGPGGAAGHLPPSRHAPGRPGLLWGCHSEHGLDASLAARHPRPGKAGLALQASGGVGFVLLEHLSRLGVGISSAVSLGDNDDGLPLAGGAVVTTEKSAIAAAKRFAGPVALCG